MNFGGTQSLSLWQTLKRFSQPYLNDLWLQISFYFEIFFNPLLRLGIRIIFSPICLDPCAFPLNSDHNIVLLAHLSLFVSYQRKQKKSNNTFRILHGNDFVKVHKIILLVFLGIIFSYTSFFFSILLASTNNYFLPFLRTQPITNQSVGAKLLR